MISPEHAQAQQMLCDGIIEPVAGPVVIVNKPDHDRGFSVDFHGLNQMMMRDSYPLQQVDESLDFLSGVKFITTLDLAQGYWQVTVARESEAAVFILHCGLFQLRVLTFGLSNVPAAFQRRRNSVLGHAVYLDDTVVASAISKQHLADSEEVLARLSNPLLKTECQCQFFVALLTFLGYRVNTGLHLDPDKVRAVVEFKVYGVNQGSSDDNGGHIYSCRHVHSSRVLQLFTDRKSVV